MEQQEELPSNVAEYSGGEASGSAADENFEESPALPFPHRVIHDQSHYYSHDERFTPMNGEGSSERGENAWNCVTMLGLFGFFVATTMIFGVYSPKTLRLGPNSSMLINPSHLFIDSIEVLEVGATRGLMLYGFYTNPPLDIVSTWSESHKTTLPESTHKEWVYYLNKGSQIKISYRVDSLSPSSILVITGGSEEFSRWLEDPSYPNSTMSWNVINGNGTIQMDVYKSSSYHIAVGNMNYETLKVELNITVKAFLFNTTEPYYKCTPSQDKCTFELSFLEGNAAVLTSPGRKPGILGGDYHVEISYGARWFAYLVALGAVAGIVLVINHASKHFGLTEPETREDQLGGVEADRAPLLITKDNNPSSWGSSDVSDTEDENCFEGGQPGNLCSICFDAPKDCFFIPCGHCTACFACATRIAETSGVCPICRRPMKKVRKIYTV